MDKHKTWTTEENYTSDKILFNCRSETKATDVTTARKEEVRSHLKHNLLSQGHGPRKRMLRDYGKFSLDNCK